MLRKSRRVAALARVKCDLTQAEDIWRRETNGTAKLSTAKAGDFVEVLLADAGTKWWLVKGSNNSVAPGWILRSRLDLIDDGEPLQAPPAIVPSAKDLDAWAEVVAQKLSAIPTVRRDRGHDDGSSSEVDEKLEEFANKVDVLEKHAKDESESDSDTGALDLRLQIVEKMLLNLPRHVGKKRNKSIKRSFSVDPDHRLNEEPESQRPSVMMIPEEQQDFEQRSSMLLIESPRKSVMTTEDEPRKSVLILPTSVETENLEAIPFEKAKKSKSIKPWERQGFQFKEEAAGLPNPAKKKKEPHHPKLQDLFNPLPLEDDSSKAL
jgi:hypothetical protein